MASGEVSLRQTYEVVAGPREEWLPERWRSYPIAAKRVRRLFRSAIENLQADALLVLDQAYSARLADVCLWAQKRFSLALGLYCHGLDIRSRILSREVMWRKLAGMVLQPTLGIATTSQRVRCLVRRADVLFANSSYTATLLRRYSGRCAVVTGCGLAEDDLARELRYNPGYHPEEKARSRRELGLPDRPTVAFVGRLVRSKNVELLLRALSYDPGFQAVIIGEGNHRRALEELAVALGVQARVLWMGSQPEEKKWQLLRASNVLCLPSTIMPDGAVEGFGIVLLEAAAAATPVVATATGGIVDVVRHEETGLLCAEKDPRQVSQMLRRLYSERSLARLCVENAREQIRERFNWNTIAYTITSHLQRP